MTQRRRELESLLLTMFAAVPLYATRAVGFVPLILFHVAMAVIAVRVMRGQTPEILPTRVMRVLAIFYVLFYIFDAAVISRDAIAASTHLVLFIAVYQPVESLRTNNRAQRLLTAALIAVAGIATSTHISIILFLLAFVFLMFRQMMHISHAETEQASGQEYEEPDTSRSALLYLVAASIVGALLFPLLPRVRNPFVQGMAGALTNATTGLSESIDFNRERSSTPDATVVARIWMGQESIPFFTPLRLRGAVYDRFWHNEWRQTHTRTMRQVRRRASDTYEIARPLGFSRPMLVQQRFVRGTVLFLPVGTWSVAGLPVSESGNDGSYETSVARAEVINYRVRVARDTTPITSRPATVVPYPVTPAIAALAHRIGGAGSPLEQAAAIERHMSENFRYVSDPREIGHVMSVDEFLLRERRGHCEYFAAGMVALMTALEVPARIAGGFYGGRFNPLTGYFVIRREDAHAWVEVWDGGHWVTFDPTPASLRPGRSDGNWLRMYAAALSDSINYFWDRYILTFGLGDQVTLAMEVISRVRDTFRSLHSVADFARHFDVARLLRRVAVLISVALLVFLVFRRRRSLFDLLAAHLRQRGVNVGPSTTMEEALALLRREKPDEAEALGPLIAMYEAERFSASQDRGRSAAIRRELARISQRT